MAGKNTSEISALKQKIKRLSSLIRISSLLNSTLDLDEILNIIMLSSKKVMDAEAATLFLYNEKEHALTAQIAYGKVRHKIKGKLTIAVGQGIAGTVAEQREPVLVNDPGNDSRFMCRIDKKTGFVTKSIICVPLIYQDKLVGVAQALNKKSGRFTEDDLDVFCTFANQAAVAIESARLHREEMDVQRIEQELNLAQLIQNSFLPHIDNMECPEMDIGIRKTAAFNVSGDFFDIFPLDDRQIFFIFGDVAGKGIPAALFMANLLSRVRYLAFRYRCLDQVVSNLNQEIHRISQRGMFTTLVAGVVEMDKGTVQLVNCGHLPVSFYDAEKKKWVSVIGAGNIPIGIFPQVDFKSENASFRKGDMLMIFSDGAVEAKNRKGHEFGLKRINAALPRDGVSAQEIVDRVYSGLKEYCGTERFKDDVTFFALGNCLRPGKFERRICSSPIMLRELRKELELFLERYNLSELLISRMILAVDEALTNVIKYSYSGNTTMPIDMKVEARKRSIEITIRDYGIPVDPTRLRVKDLENVSPGGLGLNFIYLIMDRVKFDPQDQGTLLEMVKFI
ncbi:MAG: SpoIIE family protein phosphatase [Candidatus Wallbacteria bacterium]|nr:SpoIIE family protein phosphatase [Candidatus Wallbacteria bacterium]